MSQPFLRPCNICNAAAWLAPKLPTCPPPADMRSLQSVGSEHLPLVWDFFLVLTKSSDLKYVLSAEAPVAQHCTRLKQMVSEIYLLLVGLLQSLLILSREGALALAVSVSVRTVTFCFHVFTFFFFFFKKKILQLAAAFSTLTQLSVCIVLTRTGEKSVTKWD